MAKLRVGVIFGGRSGEHDVSLVSAKAIIEARLWAMSMITVGRRRTSSVLPGKLARINPVRI